MEEQGLEGLEIWVKARELSLIVYREVVPALPSEEQWGMASQFRRACVSVVANIAEGHGRYYFQERTRYCYMARGSLEELQTLMVLAADLGYLKPERSDVIERIHSLRKMLNGYIQYLRRRSGAGRRPRRPEPGDGG